MILAGMERRLFVGISLTIMMVGTRYIPVRSTRTFVYNGSGHYLQQCQMVIAPSLRMSLRVRLRFMEVLFLVDLTLMRLTICKKSIRISRTQIRGSIWLGLNDELAD